MTKLANHLLVLAFWNDRPGIWVLITFSFYDGFLLDQMFDQTKYVSVDKGNKVQLELLSKWAGVLVFTLDEASHSIRSAHFDISGLGHHPSKLHTELESNCPSRFYKIDQKCSKSNHYLRILFNKCFPFIEFLRRI